MVEIPLTVVWLRAALHDLDRFAEFLIEGNPQIAARIAEAIVSSTDVLAAHPLMGRHISGEPFRQLIVPVLNASYVLRYRVEGQRVIILRVFHGHASSACKLDAGVSGVAR